MLTDGSENLFYLAYGMPQSRTSRRADYTEEGESTLINTSNFSNGVYYIKLDTQTIPFTILK
jgi:hypothetical protein